MKAMLDRAENGGSAYFMDELGDILPGNSFWASFITGEGLPNSYRETAEVWFTPLVRFISKHQNEARAAPGSPPQVVGLYGCQGSGKSTLAALLEVWLRDILGFNVLRLSLDDFYLTRSQRLSVAKDINPLFATRGVPGTHDIGALETVLQAVLARRDGTLTIPQFDKATDDRAPQEKTVTTDNIDLVILEGWCVGLPPEPLHRLEHPINDLEREQDPKASWREYVNQSLAGRYAAVFELITTLVVLKAPHFDTVVNWRWEQEQKLIGRHQLASPSSHALMDRAGVERFVQFYQRLTDWGLQVMPGRADLCFHLNHDRQIESHSGPIANVKAVL